MISIPKGRIEFMEEIPRSEYVRLRVLEEKTQMLKRFLDMDQATEEVIRMIFNWPSIAPEESIEDEEEQEAEEPEQISEDAMKIIKDDPEPVKEQEPPKITPAAVKEMCLVGKTVAQIAEYFDVSKSTVYNYKKSLGLTGSTSTTELAAFHQPNGHKGY